MEERRHRRLFPPLGGIILLLLGIFLLLDNLGYLPFGFWGTIWRYWPVLLILMGISIIFRPRRW